MSIAVALHDLPSEVASRPFAYLMTTSPDGRPHGVAISPVMDAGVLVTQAGRTSARNAAERNLVALIWPPVESGGYSLIVDAVADVDGTTLRLSPTHAVLHRPATSERPIAPGCSADCAAVTIN